MISKLSSIVSTSKVSRLTFASFIRLMMSSIFPSLSRWPTYTASVTTILSTAPISLKGKTFPAFPVNYLVGQ